MFTSFDILCERTYQLCHLKEFKYQLSINININIININYVKGKETSGRPATQCYVVR